MRKPACPLCGSSQTEELRTAWLCGWCGYGFLVTDQGAVLRAFETNKSRPDRLPADAVPPQKPVLGAAPVEDAPSDEDPYPPQRRWRRRKKD